MSFEYFGWLARIIYNPIYRIQASKEKYHFIPGLGGKGIISWNFKRGWCNLLVILLLLIASWVRLWFNLHKKPYFDPLFMGCRSLKDSGTLDRGWLTRSHIGRLNTIGCLFYQFFFGGMGEGISKSLRAFLSASIFGWKQHNIRRSQPKHAPSASAIEWKSEADEQ